VNTNTLGILIIVTFIVLGIVTGGDIFRPYNFTETPTPWQQELSPQNEDGQFVSNRYRGSGYNYSNGYSYKPSATQNTRDINRLYQETYEVAEQVAQYVENQNASVYKDKITIRNVRNPESLREYITLTTNLDAGEVVALSGWHFRSLVTGSTLPIGGVATNPVIGLRTESPLIVSRGARVIVTQNRSPIGMSFRVNKCSGYLEQKNNFFPSLSTFDCPAPIEDAPSFSRDFDNACLDYIEGLPICEEPRERDTPERGLTRACENYIETQINYESCVIKHQNDLDFYKPEWRVYIGRPRTLWLEKRDKIQLIDNDGRVVDTIDY